jgi:hypothetical protein
MENKRQHVGKFEYIKFDSRRDLYYKTLVDLKEMNIPLQDLVENFTCFTGHMSLSRYLGLYELYKQTLGVSGHIAEVGTFKGASFFLFAKLIKIFESESLTQVHGFDWFGGMDSDTGADFKVEKGSYQADEATVRKLIEIQQLENLAFLHKIDVTKELKPFLNTHKHLQFKLVFLDAGLYEVVTAALPLLWERLTPGGILILDQYNHELSPGETMAVREILPHAKVKTLPNIWMPSAYIIKE